MPFYLYRKHKPPKPPLLKDVKGLQDFIAWINSDNVVNDLSAVCYIGSPEKTEDQLEDAQKIYQAKSKEFREAAGIIGDEQTKVFNPLAGADPISGLMFGDEVICCDQMPLFDYHPKTRKPIEFLDRNKSGASNIYNLLFGLSGGFDDINQYGALYLTDKEVKDSAKFYAEGVRYEKYPCGYLALLRIKLALNARNFTIEPLKGGLGYKISFDVKEGEELKRKSVTYYDKVTFKLSSMEDKRTEDEVQRCDAFLDAVSAEKPNLVLSKGTMHLMLDLPDIWNHVDPNVSVVSDDFTVPLGSQEGLSASEISPHIKSSPTKDMVGLSLDDEKDTGETEIAKRLFGYGSRLLSGFTASDMRAAQRTVEATPSKDQIKDDEYHPPKM